MASIGYVKSLLNTLPPETKGPLSAIFDYLMRQGALGDSPKATNFAWFKVSGVTAANAGAEFSIAHGLGIPPTKFIPIVDLSAIGQSLVPLVVSRPPDERRVYFTSSSTSAAFSGFLE